MAFRAVLDACVLYPFSLRDLLLRLTERELYDARWSARILGEVTRNLQENEGVTEEQTRRLVNAMSATFEEAMVPLEAVDRLEPVMTNHPKDRHVLAAAVAGGAEVVVTQNLKDFPAAACEPFGVRPQHPDGFLLALLSKSPTVVLEEIDDQVATLRKPPVTREGFLRRLAVVAPTFVLAVQEASTQPASGRP